MGKSKELIDQLDRAKAPAKGKLDAFLKALPFALPADYVAFLRESNGAEGDLGKEHVMLFAYDEMMSQSEGDLHLGMIEIGSDGGEDGYRLRLDEEPPVYIRFNRETGRSKRLANSFADLLRAIAGEKPKVAKGVKKKAITAKVEKVEGTREIARIGVIQAMAFSQDGSQILTVTYGAKIGIRDANTLALVKETAIEAWTPLAAGHRGGDAWVVMIQGAPPHRGPTIIDAMTGKKLGYVEAKLSAGAVGALSPDLSNGCFASDHHRGCFNLKKLKLAKGMMAHVNEAPALAYSADGSILWQGGEAGAFWDANGPAMRDRKASLGMIIQYNAAGEAKEIIEAHAKRVVGLSVSSDDKLLSCDAGSAAIWDKKNLKKPIKRFNIPGGPIRCCTWIPGKNHFAVGTKTGQISVIDAGSGKTIQKFKTKTDGANLLVASPTGNLIAASAGASRERIAASGVMLFALT